MGHETSSIMLCLAVPRVYRLQRKLRTDVNCTVLYGVFASDLWEILTAKDVKGRIIGNKRLRAFQVKHHVWQKKKYIITNNSWFSLRYYHSM